MRSLLIVFFIVLLLMCILFFPFKTRFMTHLNLLNTKCFYCLKIWRIKLLCGMMYLDSGKFKIENSNNILSKEVDQYFALKLASEILSRLDVKKIEVFFTGGFVDDSYLSAIVCGTVSSIIYSIYGYLSQKYEDIKMYEDVKTTFDESNFEVTFDAVVSVSLFQIFVSIFKAGLLKKKFKEELK